MTDNSTGENSQSENENVVLGGGLSDSALVYKHGMFCFTARLKTLFQELRRAQPKTLSQTGMG